MFYLICLGIYRNGSWAQTAANQLNCPLLERRLLWHTAIGCSLYTTCVYLLFSHLSDLHGRYKLGSVVGFPSRVSSFHLVCNGHIPSYLRQTRQR